MVIPDRIGQLIERVASGAPLTRADLERVATLQALDLAKLGEDFARQQMADDEQLTKTLEAAP